MRKTLLFALFLPALNVLYGQPQADIVPLRTDRPVEIDGKLNDPAWRASEGVSNFWQTFPTDSTQAEGQTEVQMAYDDDYLYVAVIAHSRGNEFVIPSLRRDYSFRFNDNITLVFDTYNDKTNAFVFGMNPYGVRREALIANGGRQPDDFASSWDNKWFGEANRKEDCWVAEFAIPFKTLRFQKGSTEWRFNCYRSDTQLNEWSTWAPIPRNRLVMDLSFMGKIRWPEPLEDAGTNISLIPYTTANSSRDFEDPEQMETDFGGNFGGDAKIAVTPGLNLDLTVNPDFSQVEVDQQVTNLDRFEIFFPERRQFFLENADLFASFGLSRVNPFFSRRIGVARDTATGQNIQNAIPFGARLSGKLNENLRVGLLNMQTADQPSNGAPTFNYSVAALQQKVFNRSNVSFLFVNKQAINGGEIEGDFNNYNRVAGLEYRLLSADNRWSGKFFYHHSFSPEPQKYPFTQGAQVEYLRRKYRLEWAHNLVGEGFIAEVGFVPRRDYLLMSPEAQIFFYPQKGVINEHSINIDTRFFLQIGKDGNEIIEPWGLSERQTELNWDLDFSNTASAGLTVLETDLTLLRDFDPTRIQEEGVVLPKGSSHHFISVSAEYSSDQRRDFFYGISPVIGQFYNGFRAGLSGSITYRFQPYGSVSMTYNYNHIKLDDPFEAADIWLVGPRFDFTFTRSLFLTTFVQYNSQLDNVNINTRFQWRFAPVSDFFLVYTDNYLTDSFSQFAVRNRALVAKVTYWLNL